MERQPQTSGRWVLFVAVVVGAYVFAQQRPSGTGGTVTRKGGGNPAGQSSQVQYNADGVFGATTGVETDTQHLRIVYDYVAPGIPDSGTRAIHYDFAPDSGWFPTSYVIDSTTGIPLSPSMVHNGLIIPTIGTKDVWQMQCHFPDTYPQGATYAQNALSSTAAIQIASANGTSGLAFDAGTWWGQQHWVIGLTNAGTTGNAVQAAYESTVALKRGLLGAGGFITWHRFSILGTFPAGCGRRFFGLANRTTVFTAAAEPENQTNTIWAGCPYNNSNMGIYSNDSSGSATLNTDLGASFPCKTAGYGYDVWFYAPPSSSVVYWFVSQIPSPDPTQILPNVTASGMITTDLPEANALLAIHNESNNSDSGLADRMGWGPMCAWQHW